jgi:hypothetical protein
MNADLLEIIIIKLLYVIIRLVATKHLILDKNELKNSSGF